jgi:hypothetical protein
MMTTTCQLLYDFIYHKTKSNSEETNKILELLIAETSQSFDDNVDNWTEWFLSGSFEVHEKNFIKTANRLYKVHLKLKSNA